MSGHLFRESDGRVGFAELFYDLVFVFAITQISHFLLHHYDAKGALETAILFLAVWWVWIYTTWVLNWLDPNTFAVRLMLFGSMVLGLFVSMSIPEAFGERGLIFALSFSAMQVGRSALTIWFIAGLSARHARNFTRITIWLAVSGAFWIGGGLVEGNARIVLWLMALAIEYAAPAVAFWVPGLGRSATAEWDVRGEHIAERCGLFVIICLGETLLISGATFAEMPWDGAGLAAFMASALSSIAMWWVYFHIGQGRGAHLIEHSDDPGRIARLAFTYAHIPIVAGIVLAAVGAERAIAHPLHAGTYAEAASVVGGVALFLLGNGAFKRISGRWFPLSHLAGVGASAAIFALAPVMTLLSMNILATGIVLVVAVWEHLSLGRRAVSA